MFHEPIQVNQFHSDRLDHLIDTFVFCIDQFLYFIMSGDAASTSERDQTGSSRPEQSLNLPCALRFREACVIEHLTCVRGGSSHDIIKVFCAGHHICK